MDVLLVLLMLRKLGSLLLAPLATTHRGAPLPCQVESVLWHHADRGAVSQGGVTERQEKARN